MQPNLNRLFKLIIKPPTLDELINDDLMDGCNPSFSYEYFSFLPPPNLLSYYLANKRSLHVRSQGLEILTLIGEKNKITHHCHYDKICPKYPCGLIKINPPLPLKNNLKYSISYLYELR